MSKTYIADKETQDAIKSDTTAILEELRDKRPKRYGYRVKEIESNPSTRVEYLFDAVGMTPAKMDYNLGSFNYGSWADIWFVKNNYPCMVKNDGSVDYKLNPNDYTKREDGTASDVANTAYAGNAMSAIPLVWVKRYHENGYRYVIFCEEQYDETYKAYAHTRTDGSVSAYAYGAMFEGSLHSETLRSLSGLKPMSEKTAADELAAAQKNGHSWTLETWAFWNLIHDLLILLGKSTNVQGTYGQGHTEGGSAAEHLLTCGTLNTKGQFFGYSNTTSAVKVFHMENFWGDRWDRIVGMIYDNSVYKVKMTPEGNGYNFAGSGYTVVWKGILADATGGGYVNRAQQSEFGLFPMGLTGSAATHDCDYHYHNPAIVSVPLVGGACVNGSFCGRCLCVNDTAGSAWWTFGASLFLNNPS